MGYKIRYPSKFSDDKPEPMMRVSNFVYEERQRRLLCYECGKPADTWFRNLTTGVDYNYNEFMLCAECRGKYLVDKVKDCAKIKWLGQEFEVYPIGEEGEATGNKDSVPSESL